MPLSSKQFESLKKESATVNKEKTKVRAHEAFKKANTEQKNEIYKLSGLSKYAFYGIKKDGAVSVKAALALAQVLQISPFFLVGENDDDNYSDDILKDFYKKYTSGALKKAAAKKDTAKPAAKKSARAKTPVVKEKAVKTAPAPKKPKAEKAVAAISAPKAPAVKPAKSVAIDDLAAVKLLEALAIKAKYSKDAADTYKNIVALLVK